MERLKAELCKCGHPRKKHIKDKDCLVVVSKPSEAVKYCRCYMFRSSEVKSA